MKKITEKEYDAVRFKLWQKVSAWSDTSIIQLASDLLGMVSRRKNGQTIIDHSEELEW